MAKQTGYKITAGSAKALAALLGSQKSPAVRGRYNLRERFSKVCLAQAPVGGIPARSGATPGEATCTQVIVAPLAGTGFSAGDLVKTELTFTVLNWDLIEHGVDGDRIVQVSNHSDGAWLVGSSCTNENAASGIKLYEPT